MNKGELIEKCTRLRSDMEAINTWIENNPETDPNIYEMCDCWLKLGTLASEISKYGNSHNSDDSYEVGSYMLSCHEEMKKMENLRDIYNHTFFVENGDALSLYQNEIVGDALVCSTDYDNVTKELLKKSLSVPFYIWQEQQKNSAFRYDNEKEFYLVNTYFDVVGSNLDNSKRFLVSNFIFPLIS